MVKPLVVFHALDGGDVLRLLDDADLRAVALFRGADGARILVGEIAADAAEADLLPRLDDRFGERLRLRRVHVEDVISKTHCRLGANARQCAKVFDEFCQRCDVLHLRTCPAAARVRP